ncbi:MAG: hypothetical protein LBS01_10495 [Prevotellaceae bacterium]|jgi:hypothetical protein|nr:hypothetical protein [Prevotellaceae bacterium]
MNIILIENGKQNFGIKHIFQKKISITRKTVTVILHAIVDLLDNLIRQCLFTGKQYYITNVYPSVIIKAYTIIEAIHKNDDDRNSAELYKRIGRQLTANCCTGKKSFAPTNC